MEQWVDAGLVLEGGGMRGIYTVGILDYFMEKDLYFKNTYGVSAGSCHACSYLAKQKMRAYRISLNYLNDKHYCSLYSLLTTGDLFGADMCYRQIPDELDPFDYEEYEKKQGTFYSVVTNCKTGKAEYLPIENMKKDIEIVRASASLPGVSRMVEVQGEKYLDGGLSDSIPVKQARKDGNEKVVVVLTRDPSYRKEPNSLMPFFKIKYRNYPKLIHAMEQRHIIYNKTLDYIARGEESGKFFVLRPQEPVSIGRIEKDRTKLIALYHQGYEDAKNLFESMMDFLETGQKKTD
ncbi:MAG: patatin family protein [Lachnospiraceae bacterium]|nr:patatin family protein [Lachnospiraceae bacterium]